MISYLCYNVGAEVRPTKFVSIKRFSLLVGGNCFIA